VRKPQGKRTTEKMNNKKINNPWKKRCKRLVAFLILCFGLRMSSMQTGAAETEQEVLAKYEDYEKCFASITTLEDIAGAGFEMIEDQVFPVVLESFPEKAVTFIPAIEPKYHRLAIFIVDSMGRVLYKTNQLETNNLYRGMMEQPTHGIAAVSFQDINLDGWTDIILITNCVNDKGEYAGKTYKTGDILFQCSGGFYRDYRISDKVNRFGMNKSANCIAAFVREGQSTEFLYTATTLEELLKEGFQIIEEQCYERKFEKLGRLKVVPGVFEISEYDIFMIYLVNEQGYIVWCFQPMGDYDNLYSLKGITGKDVDGDGMKDLVVLARYSYENEVGEFFVESDCSIYYQRTGEFDIDTDFENYYRCTEENTLEELVTKIREYWGWEVETEVLK